MEKDSSNPLHVAVGVILADDGRILISKRDPSSHQGGLWEFPGGKLEAGETAVEALIRELHEELNINVSKAVPLITIKHSYPDRCVLLDVWKILAFRGNPLGRENQPIAWVSLNDINGYAFPEANRPIIAALRLPEIYPILNVFGSTLDLLRTRAQQLLNQGFKMLRFRRQSLSVEKYKELVASFLRSVDSESIEILVDPHVGLDANGSIAGFHLTSRALMGFDHRPLPKTRLVGASCHNAEELRHANYIGVDFAVLSPVLPTTSHASVAPLGWKTFQRLVAEVNIPVYALGGLQPADLDRARCNGAQGIAGISAFIA